MRLQDSDIDHIIESFKQHFGKDDHLWLFGSRVDLEKRGGDIDLYVETHLSLLPSEIFSKKLRFIGDLWRRIGERKIDVVLNVLGNAETLPIYEVAKTEGVRLL